MMTVISMEKADVILTDWNIVQIQASDGNFGELFIGYSIHDGLGRVSTRIESFDEKTKTGQTHSGSNYELKGEPGRPHQDALYVLETAIGAERVNGALDNPDGYMGLRFRYLVK